MAQDGTYVVTQSGAFCWRDERRTDGGDAGCCGVSGASSTGSCIGSNGSVWGPSSSDLIRLSSPVGASWAAGLGIYSAVCCVGILPPQPSRYSSVDRASPCTFRTSTVFLQVVGSSRSRPLIWEGGRVPAGCNRKPAWLASY